MNVEISVEYPSWNSINNLEKITEECIETVFEMLNKDSLFQEVCVLFTNDDEIKCLNKTFRGIDKPTHVLSFPAIEEEEWNYDDFENNETERSNILGSIAIAYETLEREAKEQQKIFTDHLKHLLVHSMLHLFGYDHIDVNEANEMETLEIKILEKLNVKNPYE